EIAEPGQTDHPTSDVAERRRSAARPLPDVSVFPSALRPLRLPRLVRKTQITTTIFPLAWFASTTRCASRMSSKRNTRDGFALYRPAATSAAIACNGTSDNGNPGVPNTKLAKKVR